MGKEKFYYNTDTCKFEKVKKTNKEYFLNFIGLITLILLTSIGLVSLYDAYFESPKIIQLKKENNELQTHYEILNKEVNIAYKMLENLEQRDDNIYRIIFEAEPIPSSIRKVGIGGVNRYKDLLDGKL